MYKCPKGCQHDGGPSPAFEVEETHRYVTYLNPNGEGTGHAPAGFERSGKVRCFNCHALAEWIDARQVELFPIAPTLCT